MNCLESSNIYALCCRNECEDLMAHLEQEIGSQEADPDRIMALVAGLSSETMGPRVLPASLKRRLVQVAASNGGRVLLHGRLFAQWMHHAYPRECPFPHELGTASPVTPDEWIKKTGQGSKVEEHYASRPQTITSTASQSTSSHTELAQFQPPTVVRTVSGRNLAVLVSITSSIAFILSWCKERQQKCRSSSFRGLLDGEPECIACPSWFNEHWHLAYALLALGSTAYAVQQLDWTAFTIAIL